MLELIEILQKRTLMLKLAKLEVTNIKESIELSREAIGNLWVLNCFGYHGTPNGYAFASPSYQEVVDWCETHPTWLVDTLSQPFAIVHELQPAKHESNMLVGRILERETTDPLWAKALKTYYERLKNEKNL